MTTQPLENPDSEVEISKKTLNWQVALGLLGLLVALLIGVLATLPWLVDRFEGTTATQNAIALLTTMTAKTQSSTEPQPTLARISIPASQSQGLTTGGSCDTVQVQQILNDINTVRIASNLTPLVLNEDLCNMAFDQAQVIIDGDYPSGNPSKRRSENGNTDITDWVKQTNFTPYPTNDGGVDYAVDMRTFVTQIYDYEGVINYLLESDLEDNITDIFRAPQWREIGIAHVLGNTNADTTHNYVFIVGSQPNVIPIIGYIPGSEHIPVSAFPSNQIRFWISNENYYTGSDSEIIGAIHYFAINENLKDLDQLHCPPTSEDLAAWKWNIYSINILYQTGREVGARTLYIRLCDGNGRSITLPIEITVSTGSDITLPAKFDSINVSFNAEPSQGIAPLSVQFTNIPTSSMRTWEWDFDSDTVIDSTAQNPRYIYETAGSYIAKLTACDTEGYCKTFERIITVEEANCPTAKFTVNPAQGPSPLAVQFTNRSTGQIDMVMWDFESDGVGDSDEFSPTHIYSIPGTYIVRLTVSNDCGSAMTSQIVVAE